MVTRNQLNDSETVERTGENDIKRLQDVQHPSLSRDFFGPYTFGLHVSNLVTLGLVFVCLGYILLVLFNKFTFQNLEINN